MQSESGAKQTSLITTKASAVRLFLMVFLCLHWTQTPRPLRQLLQHDINLNSNCTSGVTPSLRMERTYPNTLSLSPHHLITGAEKMQYVVIVSC